MNTQRANGFTIVEMVVVLVVLGVITGLAVPAYRRWVVEDDLTVATRQVEALFRLVRDSAIRSGLPVTVTLDSVTGRVWILPPGDQNREAPAPNLEPAQQKILSQEGSLLELPASVSLQLSQQRARFRFRPSGAVFADTVWLLTPFETRLITLNPWSGDVVR